MHIQLALSAIGGKNVAPACTEAFPPSRRSLLPWTTCACRPHNELAAALVRLRERGLVRGHAQRRPQRQPAPPRAGRVLSRSPARFRGELLG
jgi:hypothetical protein